MNAKTDGWEFYTDAVGRRHWRWPAARPKGRTEDEHLRARHECSPVSLPGIVRPQADAGPRQYIGTPRQQRRVQPYAPMRLKGK